MRHYSEQTGFTLIEVLLAFWILSTILLSILMVIIKQSCLLKQDYYRTIATIQLSNQWEARPYFLQEWNKQNQALFPAGNSTMTCSKTRCWFCISWMGNKNPLCLTISKEGFHY